MENHNEEENHDEPTSSTETIPKNNEKPSLFEGIFGFTFENISSKYGIIKILHRPTDPSSLAFARIIFGFLMIVDVLEERGFGEADLKWGEPTDCRFPLFNFLKPLPLHWMCILYLIMWISAYGIMLGWNYKLSCFTFAVPYWYLFLLDKTSWNNHSYMFGILVILFMATDSHALWSIDALRGNIKYNSHVPLWNYTILRFQIFLLYFYAGLKKTEVDWLNGYSMSTLSNHWVFAPMKLVLNTEQIDLWVVHGFGFLIDLTVGFMVYFDKTRALSFYILTAFHLMNSQMFHIGMFPFVCLATMPLFSSFDWPRHFFLMQSDRLKFLVENEPVRNPKCHYPVDDKDGKIYFSNVLPLKEGDVITDYLTFIIPIFMIYDCHNINYSSLIWELYTRCILINCIGAHAWLPFFVLSSYKPKKWETITVVMLSIHVFFQLFLPYSHFLTQGYNNWTNGLYGYSWDMMVHTWDTSLVTVRVVNKDTNESKFIDPEAWVQNSRWQRHADMIVQYSNCIKKNLKEMNNMNNIAIYVDIWVSLNKRFHQRMFDPRVDILTADWSPFEPVSWVMPLLNKFTSNRDELKQIEKDVLTWSNYSDALFMADFPGFKLENYVHKDLDNITLTVLEGALSVAIGKRKSHIQQGGYMKIPSDTFHNLHTISDSPSAFMYTYYNRTKANESLTNKEEIFQLPLIESLIAKWDNIFNAIGLLSQSILRILFSEPMIRRVKLEEINAAYY